MSDIDDEKVPIQKPDDILEQVSETLDAAVEEKKQAKEQKKLKTKRDYILAIKKLTNKYSDRELTRSKKDDLKKILAGSFEETVEKVAVPDPNQGLVVSTMYRLSLGVCSLVEGLSKTYGAAYLGYELHDYARTIDENPGWRMTMISVLEEVYKENQEMLSGLMTKEGRLMFVLIMAGMQSARKSSKITKGSARGYPTRMEQNNHHRGGPQSGEKQPGPIPRAQSGDRPKPRLRSSGGRDFSVRKWGELPAVELAQETAQSLPRAGGIGNPRMFSNQRTETAEEEKMHTVPTDIRRLP